MIEAEVGRESCVGENLISGIERFPQEQEKRDKAIKQFEKGITFYYSRKNQKAIKEFQKILDEYSSVIDVANKARQYIEFCKK